jgi:hypothetical protein
MKCFALLALVAASGLMTGCVCMTSPMCKKDQTNVEVGRYELAGDGQGRFMKIDSRTGETWLLAPSYPVGNSWINMK